MATVAAFGSWTSPITTTLLVEGAVTLAFPHCAGGELYWLESRPNEAGRSVIVCKDESGTIRDAIPAEFSARTLVHEYGGRPYSVHDGVIYFSNFEDQVLYRLDPGSAPMPITEPPPLQASVRYAAPLLTPDGRFVIAVRERHLDDEVVNDLVAIAADSSFQIAVVASGHDFYGTPAISPDGTHLAFCAWDHPNMPWDESVLCEAMLDDHTSPAPLRVVVDRRGESVTQPRYDRVGRLHFISDRSGWWNIYADDGKSGSVVGGAEAEFAGPDWVFGLSSYGFFPDGTLAVIWSSGGTDHFGLIDPLTSRLEEVISPFRSLSGLEVRGTALVAVAGSSRLPASIVEFDLPTRSVTTHRASREITIDAAYLAEPEAIEFPTENGLTAHGFFYAPTNRDFKGPPNERPPLIVASHGGPTSSASSLLRYDIQFWTSRGFGLVDVNYGGSSGYGRAYRDRLRGLWGVVDVDDCVNAAMFLGARGDIDPRRVVIHGGSAGGFTTLCALTFRRDFAAGASYYGVADAGALARETHKFESRYLDGLIGPWPEARALYEERSPIFHTEELSTPLILFQGLEDKIVPPDQAAMMADALRQRGVPFTHITYEGEQHGFRRAENIMRTAEAELVFYARVLGFAMPEPIEPVAIENAHALRTTPFSQ